MKAESIGYRRKGSRPILKRHLRFFFGGTEINMKIQVVKFEIFTAAKMTRLFWVVAPSQVDTNFSEKYSASIFRAACLRGVTSWKNIVIVRLSVSRFIFENKLPHSVQVKNSRSYTATPLYVFMR